MSKIHSNSQLTRTTLLIFIGVGIVGVIAQIIITTNAIVATNKVPKIKQATVESQKQNILKAHKQMESQTQQIDIQNQEL